MTRIALAFALTALALGTTACGPSKEKVSVTGTPASPATDGTIEVVPHPDFGNASISIALTNVTPPDRLNPTARFFVVWQKIGTAYAQIGQLKYDAGSEDKKATFEGSVLSGPFELVITAEANSHPQMPSQHMLLMKQMHGQGE